MRKGLVILGLLLALAVPGIAVLDKERTVRNGAEALLALVPVDPRSLMQGDYMRLRYRLAAEVAEQVDAPVADGLAIVALDELGVATLIRIGDPEESLAPGEHPLRFRKRGRFVRVATDAFHFQEGHERHYRGARYGAFRVAAGGDAVLVGLRDADRMPISLP